MGKSAGFPSKWPGPSTASVAATSQAISVARAETTQDRACAVAILCLLLAYAHYKWRVGLLPEMLYGCHVCALSIALGLLTSCNRVVSAGLVFGCGLGLPMWLIYVAQTGDVHPLSAWLHLLPPFWAFLVVRRHGLWKRAWLAALATFVTLVVVSHFLTKPALNVNLSHQPSAEMFLLGKTLWGARACGVAMCLGLLFLAQVILVQLCPPAHERPNRAQG